jgi:hypothetical protein
MVTMACTAYKTHLAQIKMENVVFSETPRILTTHLNVITFVWLGKNILHLKKEFVSYKRF